MITEELSHGRPFQFFPFLDFIVSTLIQPVLKAVRSTTRTIRNTKNTREKPHQHALSLPPNNNGVGMGGEPPKPKKTQLKKKPCSLTGEPKINLNLVF